MFVLFLSPASAQDEMSLFSFSLDYVIALVIALTWFKTTAFYLPQSCQCLWHSSSYAMFRKSEWSSFWSLLATTRVVVTPPGFHRGACCEVSLMALSQCLLPCATVHWQKNIFIRDRRICFFKNIYIQYMMPIISNQGTLITNTWNQYTFVVKMKNNS